MSDGYLANSISVAGLKAKYDASVKRLLADKQVLAWILKYCTTEFADMSIPDIILNIEAPAISETPVLPSAAAIEGMSQESAYPDEGQVYYDIRFFARCADNDKADIRIIIDVEAQNNPNPGYDLVTRGVFYCGRMLSDQYGHTFSHSNYDQLNKVYSIWIVMNCPSKSANTISKYSIQHSSLYGKYQDTARSDLINVIMVRLPKDGANVQQEPSSIHSVLSTLLSHNIHSKEKINQLEQKYGFSVSTDFEQEVGSMCNLSQSVYDAGERNTIFSLVSKGFISLQIGAEQLKISVAELLAEMKEQGYTFPG